jgi:hypothetical protein
LHAVGLEDLKPLAFERQLDEAADIGFVLDDDDADRRVVMARLPIGAAFSACCLPGCSCHDALVEGSGARRADFPMRTSETVSVRLARLSKISFPGGGGRRDRAADSEQKAAQARRIVTRSRAVLNSSGRRVSFAPIVGKGARSRCRRRRQMFTPFLPRIQDTDGIAF